MSNDLPEEADLERGRPAPGASESTPPRWLRLGSSWAWRLLALSALAYVVIRVATLLWVAVLPLLLGGVLASLLEPVATFLERGRLPRSLASALSVLLGLSVIAATGVVLGFSLSNEMDALTSSLEQGYRQLVTWTAETAGTSRDSLQTFINSHIEKLRNAAGSVAKQVLSRVPRVVQGLTVAVLAFIFAWFFVWDGRQQFDRAAGMLRPGARRHAHEIGERVWRAVGGYMRGMLVVAAADSLLLGLGLWAIGLPLVLPLMMLMFVSAFVPFVGPVVTGALACLIALGSGGAGQAGLVVALSFAVQQIEGNFLAPFVMGRAVELHPAMVLFAITAGGALGGVVGVFLAIPAVASLGAILQHWHEHTATR